MTLHPKAARANTRSASPRVPTLPTLPTVEFPRLLVFSVGIAYYSSMGNRERALDLMERIIPLRQQLRELEVELDQLLPPEDSGDGGRSTKHSRPALPGMTTPIKAADAARSGRPGMSRDIREWLAIFPDQEFTTREIQDALGLGAERLNSLYASLSRMAGTGEIAKGSQPGTYRAVTTNKPSALGLVKGNEDEVVAT